MVDSQEPPVTVTVEQTLLFLNKMSFPAFRSDESENESGPYTAESDPLAVKTRKGKPAVSKNKYGGPRCSVLYCTNKKDESDPDMSFHRFPKSPAMQRIWARRTRPPITANLQNRFVCAIHFDTNVLRGDFKDSKRRLKRSAIPTLHLPPAEGEDGEPALPPDLDRSSELEISSEPEIDVGINDASGPQMDLSRDIEMVELSSSEEEVEVPAADPRLTPADALAATSALQIPARPTQPAQKPKVVPPKQQRKSFGNEASPVKSVTEGSMDGSYQSDEEGDDDDIALVPLAEVDHLDLQDPLEKAYVAANWKTMDEKNRRHALRQYFSRIASYLPPRFPRNSKMAILESAVHYLEEVTKSNAVLAVEDEILVQKNYKLRNVLRKLEKKDRRRTVRR